MRTTNTGNTTNTARPRKKRSGLSDAEAMFFYLELLSMDYEVDLFNSGRIWYCRIIHLKTSRCIICDADVAYKAVKAAFDAVQKGKEAAS